MKQYPSISKKTLQGLKVIAFEKLDGSNIRVEWSLKSGLTKFGSRKRLLDETSPIIGEAVTLIKTQEEELANVMKRCGYKEALFYFEFLGDNSFAGQHVKESHRCVLLDVEIPKKGFLTPDKFEEMFSDLETVQIPKVLYRGEITDSVEQRLRSAPDGEGVVCKASIETYHNAMFKIKTEAWIEKVHKLYSDPKILAELL